MPKSSLPNFDLDAGTPVSPSALALLGAEEAAEKLFGKLLCKRTAIPGKILIGSAWVMVQAQRSGWSSLSHSPSQGSGRLDWQLSQSLMVQSGRSSSLNNGEIC